MYNIYILKSLLLCCHLSLPFIFYFILLVQTVQMILRPRPGMWQTCGLEHINQDIAFDEQRSACYSNSSDFTLGRSSKGPRNPNVDVKGLNDYFAFKPQGERAIDR